MRVTGSSDSSRSGVGSCQERPGNRDGEGDILKPSLEKEHLSARWILSSTLSVCLTGGTDVR